MHAYNRSGQWQNTVVRVVTLITTTRGKHNTVYVLPECGPRGGLSWLPVFLEQRRPGNASFQTLPGRQRVRDGQTVHEASQMEHLFFFLLLVFPVCSQAQTVASSLWCIISSLVSNLQQQPWSVCSLLTFTFTFSRKEFSRRFYPKRLICLLHIWYDQGITSWKKDDDRSRAFL